MGWQSCPFLIAPEELKTVFEPFQLVIDNACVPIDYTNTPVEEFLKTYSVLYEQLLSGEAFDGKYPLKHIAVTSDLSHIKFGVEHELDGKRVKAVIHDKKSILPYLAPFTFGTYMENDRLYVSTRASYLAYSESIFGYELNFPRFSRSDADYYGLAGEKELRSYPDYALFRKNIMKITAPFCFRLNGAVKKTSIRISGMVKEHLPDFYLIKSRGIEVL